MVDEIYHKLTDGNEQMFTKFHYAAAPFGRGFISWQRQIIHSEDFRQKSAGWRPGEAAPPGVRPVKKDEAGDREKYFGIWT